MFSIHYAVPMHCDGCKEDVAAKLRHTEGVEDFNIDLQNQRVKIEGTAPPSRIVENMQSIGKDAFVRGSGKPNTSAVAILETIDGEVCGLTHIITAGSGILFDISAKHLAGNATLGVHKFGDISQGLNSTGPEMIPLGRLESSGKQFIQVPSLSLSDLIGRSIVIQSNPVLFGVIARSAGVWENDKTVCSCSGQTLWEEREKLRARY